jgi:hypothetical protein
MAQVSLIMLKKRQNRKLVLSAAEWIAILKS